MLGGADGNVHCVAPAGPVATEHSDEVTGLVGDINGDGMTSCWRPDELQRLCRGR